MNGRPVSAVSRQQFVAVNDSHRKGLLICVAYAATCGGITTIPGTGANILMKGVVDRLYDGTGLTFGTWMVFALPLSVMLLITCWLWMHTYFFGVRSTFLSCGQQNNESIRRVLQCQYDLLGPMRFAEKIVALLVSLMILLWMTRESEIFPGWGTLLPKGFVSDASTAMLIAWITFLIPANRSPETGKWTTLMDWETVAHKFPWHVMLLFGGSFALAGVCQKGGLASRIVSYLGVLKGLSHWATGIIVSLMAALITEVMSNAAVASLLLPIIADLATDLQIHPFTLLISGTVSCSFAFMLPTATPPNAVVYSLGGITVCDMMKAGLLMNVISLLALTLAINTWGVAIFHLDTFPEWANRTVNITV